MYNIECKQYDKIDIGETKFDLGKNHSATQYLEYFRMNNVIAKPVMETQHEMN